MNVEVAGDVGDKGSSPHGAVFGFSPYCQRRLQIFSGCLRGPLTDQERKWMPRHRLDAVALAPDAVSSDVVKKRARYGSLAKLVDALEGCPDV